MDIGRVNDVLTKAIIELQDGEAEAMVEAMARGKKISVAEIKRALSKEEFSGYHRDYDWDVRDAPLLNGKLYIFEWKLAKGRKKSEFSAKLWRGDEYWTRWEESDRMPLKKVAEWVNERLSESPSGR